ncbi:unnamed protein product [Aphanomyces euteiches]
MASVFAGCGSASSTDSTASPSVKADTATAAPVASVEASAAPVPTTKAPTDYKGTIVMWGWDEKSVTNSLPEFNKVYPNIKLEFVNTPGGDYLKKLQSTVAAGIDLPDIVWENMADRGSLYEMNGLLDDLSQAPYNADKSTIFDVGVQTTSDAQGKLLGIPWDMGIGGLMYRRDLTKQYYGTDDPAELAKLFPTWDALLNSAKDVTAKSSGKVFLFPGINDLLTMTSGQDASPVSEGNTLLFDKTIKPQLEMAIKARDAGATDKLKQWTPGWSAAFADGKHIFFSGPMWGPRWMAEANDKDGKGRWGLMAAPGGGFDWGGTALGITQKSKNKDAAWEFVKWFLLSKDGANYNKDNNGYYVHYKPSFEDASYISRVNPFFNNQDLGLVYKDIVTSTKLRPVSKFDNEIGNSYGSVTEAIQNDSKLTLDAAAQKFKDSIKIKFSDADIK